jgi:solute carrier family 25 (mitochondrial phosphate transporter), member 3
VSRPHNRLQVDPKKYGGIGQGFSVIAKESGMAGLVRGWVPTLLGYSAQGSFKFGLYEYFKKTYSDMAGEEVAKKYQNLIYLAGSASAEFFADIALCPFEAVKVTAGHMAAPLLAHHARCTRPRLPPAVASC